MADAQVPSRLTFRKREIMQLLDAFIREHGYCPTVREIQATLGLASESTVHTHLTDLRDKWGYITWETGQNRTLRLTPKGKLLLDSSFRTTL